jgi:energy-coupling factor transporter transmembrane protein EcfT
MMIFDSPWNIGRFFRNPWFSVSVSECFLICSCISRGSRLKDLFSGLPLVFLLFALNRFVLPFKYFSVLAFSVSDFSISAFGL